MKTLLIVIGILTLIYLAAARFGRNRNRIQEEQEKIYRDRYKIYGDKIITPYRDMKGKQIYCGDKLRVYFKKNQTDVFFIGAVMKENDEFVIKFQNKIPPGMSELLKDWHKQSINVPNRILQDYFKYNL
jgi:hypothetical protein